MDMELKEALRIARSYVRFDEYGVIYYRSPSVMTWPEKAADEITFRFCKGSMTLYNKWVKERLDRLPIWITHPDLYSSLMEYSKICNHKTESRNKTSKIFVEDTGVDLFNTYLETGYEFTYDDVVKDEDKLFIWRMSH